MAEPTPAPSQENAPGTAPDSPQNVNSSPILPAQGSTQKTKPRKPPTITPRTFTRFFTPKSSLERGGRIGASRQALRDITASGANRRGRKTPRKDEVKVEDFDKTSSHHGNKRKRRIPYSPDPMPELSSPLKRLCNQSMPVSEDEGGNDGSVSEDEESVDGGSSEPENAMLRATKNPRSRRPPLLPIARSRFIDGFGLQR